MENEEVKQVIVGKVSEYAYCTDIDFYNKQNDYVGCIDHAGTIIPGIDRFENGQEVEVTITIKAKQER